LSAVSYIDIRLHYRLAILSVLGAAAAFLIMYLARTRQGLPYHDSFASGVTTEWHAFGGNWETYDGAIRNNSDERGAKFLSGSPGWSDYSVEADILLLGQNGDAGLIVRSSDEEEGVDSYSGYYVGLRDHDGTVAIGRADHGWIEYDAVPVKAGIHPFRWYHLRVVAVGCEIAALALDPVTQLSTVATLNENEKDCARAGRVGLRSYSSGGIWKNVSIAAAGPAELALLKKGTQVPGASKLTPSDAELNSLVPYPSPEGSISGDLSFTGPTIGIRTPPISSLRLVSDLRRAPVAVRGSIVLTSPTVYIQDSTAGIAIESPQDTFLKIGDEIEATGTLEPRGFSGVLKDARVRLLRSKGPAPPLSVTASQAATGKFDGMFIEIGGRLEDKPRVVGQSVILDIHNGHQAYPAILKGVYPDPVVEKLQRNSLLRLRGVCVVDPAYTKNLTSFVLLLRSSQDIAVVAGPPWWDKRYLIEIGFALIVLTFLGILIYITAEHWRLRAVLEERSRMAREIHDTLAQGFAGIALQLESALQQSRAENVEIGSVAMAFHMAQESRREAHRSIAALRTLHTNESLENMLQKVLRPQVAGSRLDLSFSRSGDPQRLSAESEGQVLRIAQEAVANAVQHAMAKQIEVRLVFEQNQLRVEITDNGRGFNLSGLPAVEDGHFGITGMKERANSIGADFKVQSNGDGTMICLIVPLPRQRAYWRSVNWWMRPFKTSMRPSRSG